jgi:hypothetical protein
MGLVTRARLIRGAVAPAHQTVEDIALVNGSGADISAADLPLAAAVTATAIATAAKTVATPEPLANTLVPIKFTNGNSAASPTVAFNGGAPRNILLGGTAPLAGEVTIGANGVALFWFDGTSLHQVGVYS